MASLKIIETEGSVDNLNRMLADTHADIAQIGEELAYRYLPFWVANLFDRTVVVLLPTLLVVIPALRRPARTQNRSTYCANTYNSFGKISLDRR